MEAPRGTKLKERSSRLGKSLRCLVNNVAFHDVVFLVGPEQYKIYALKGILVARCKFFEALLFNGMKETKESVIVLPDVDASSFEKIIQFIYCGELEPLADLSELMLLFHTADKLLVEPLCECILEAVAVHVEDVDIASKYLEDALAISHPAFEVLFMEQIAKNAKEAIERAHYVEYSEGTMHRITSEPSLECTELDLFKAILKWGDYNSATPQTISSLLTHVKFDRIRATDLAAVVEPTGYKPFLSGEAAPYNVTRHLYPFAWSRKKAGSTISFSADNVTAISSRTVPDSATDVHEAVLSARSFTTGKHYWEVKILKYCSALWIGVAGEFVDVNQWLGRHPQGFVLGSHAVLCTNTGRPHGPYDRRYGKEFNVGDSISVYLDMDARKCHFGVNGEMFPVAFENLPPKVYAAASLTRPGCVTLMKYQEGSWPEIQAPQQEQM